MLQITEKFGYLFCMIIYEGIVSEIVDPSKRIIKCRTLDYDQFITCQLLFANTDIEVNDSVIVFVLNPKTLSNGYAIPVPYYIDEQGMNSIRIFYKQNEVEIDKEKIKIIFDKKNEEAYLFIDKDNIEIKKKDKALIHLKNEYIEINTKELYVPGMPRVNQSESTGGFSQILFCPFTGLPHNTDTLEQAQ